MVNIVIPILPFQQVTPTFYDSDFNNIGSRLQKFEVSCLNGSIWLSSYLQSSKIVIGLLNGSIFKGG